MHTRITRKHASSCAGRGETSRDARSICWSTWRAKVSAGGGSMHTVKKTRRGSTSKRRRLEQGAGLSEYLFGPSDEAKARVEEIRARWAKLQAWGIAKKLPNTRQSQEFVASFLKEWETSPQVEKITAATTDVMMMDRYAEEYD